MYKIKSLIYLLVILLLSMLEYSCTIESDNSVELKNANEEVFNFQTVDVRPQIIGVDESLSKEEKSRVFMISIMKHVRNNFNYPEQSKEDYMHNRSVVQFIFGEDGKVRDIQVIRGKNEEFNKEAVRVVSLIPDVTPAQQNGKTVAVSFMLPIYFHLQ